MQQEVGFREKWLRRWKQWRKDPELMATYAAYLLDKCNVCSTADSTVRCFHDRQSGGLIFMVYLNKPDSAVWLLGRHVEYYLMRQFRQKYGIKVHSVHLCLSRETAFAETPKPKSSGELRAALRSRRKNPWASGSSSLPDSRLASSLMPSVFGRPATHAGPPPPPSSGTPLNGKPVAAPTPPSMADPKKDLLSNSRLDYSKDDFEVSDVDFEEFANSMTQERPSAPAPVSATPVLMDFDPGSNSSGLKRAA